MIRWSILVAAVLVAALCGCSKESSPTSPVYRIPPEALTAVRPGDVWSAGYRCEYIGTGIAINSGRTYSDLRAEIDSVVRNMGGNAFHVYHMGGDTRADFFAYSCSDIPGD